MTDLPVRLAAGLLGTVFFGFVLAQAPHLVHHIWSEDTEHEPECPFELAADRLNLVLTEPDPPPLIWLAHPLVSVAPVATVSRLAIEPRPSRAPPAVRLLSIA